VRRIYGLIEGENDPHVGLINAMRISALMWLIIGIGIYAAVR
jgi:hypothetical protein